MSWWLLLLVPLFFSSLTAYVAVRKGYRAGRWLLLGLVLGALATAALIFLPPSHGASSDAPDSR